MSYPGSKAQAGVWQRIIGQMPPHSVYVEAFFGSGQVFWRKRRAQQSIVIDRLPGVLTRAGAVTGVKAIYGDALVELPRLALPADAVIYIDPPYVLSTRAGRRYYKFEFSDEQHSELLSLIKSFGCRVLLSGYPSELYGAALQGWRCCRYRVRTRGRTVTECLWCNFPEPEELHDWRFAGQSFRERFSWGRFVRRWLARIEAMPPRKRGYLLYALQEAIAQRQARSWGPGPSAAGSAAGGVGIRNSGSRSAAVGVTVPNATDGALGLALVDRNS